MYTSQLIVCSTNESHLIQLQHFWSGQQQTSPAPADFHIYYGDEEEVRPIQIADVREILGALVYKPYQGDKSWFVLLHIDQASLPAQQALLKSLEEPPKYVQFFLSCTNLTSIPLTIQSRCVIHNIAQQKTSFVEPLINQAIDGSMAAIFQLSEKYKEKAEALKLVSQLLIQLHQNLEARPSLKVTQLLQRLQWAEESLKQNVNTRMVIEGLFF